MAQQQVATFDISQDDYNQVIADGKGVVIYINYYNDPPVGYEVILQGPGGRVVLCARPCTSIVLPTQS